MIRQQDQLEFGLRPDGERRPPVHRVDTGPTRLGDRVWWDAALSLALELAARDGIVWPDDLTAEMARRGHQQPLAQAVSSFWAWAAKHGLRQAGQRRMSRDPDRNGSKIFAWERST